MDRNRSLIAAAALVALGVQAAAASPPAGVHRQQEARHIQPSKDRDGVVRPIDTGDQAWPDAARDEAVAAALQRFDAVDLSGRRWTPADLRGRVLLLDFWATWCAPCLADLPRLQALWHRHTRDEFEIVGISLDAKSRRAFVSWLNRNRIGWPQIHERKAFMADVPRLFGIERLPSTVVVDRDGRAVAVDLRGDRLEAFIDALLASGGRTDTDEARRP